MNEIDEQIIELLDERFDLSWEIGGYKKEHSIPVTDQKTENSKLAFIDKIASEENAENIKAVYRKIFEESKKIQNNI